MSAADSQIPVEREDLLPAAVCPLCGATVQDVRRVGFWDGLRGWGQWFSGRCTDCDVGFRLEVGTNAHPWRIDAPEAESLQSVVSETELTALTGKLSRYKILGTKWKSFLNRRRPGDVLWRYCSDDGTTGIANVRDGRPVARFVKKLG